MDVKTYDELVDMIYAAIGSPNMWGSFGRRLSDVLNAMQVHIQAFDLETQAFSYSSGGGVPSDAEMVVNEVAYLHYPATQDSRLAILLNTPVDQWAECHHYISDEYVQQSELYQQILLPLGLRYVAGKNILADEKLCVFICIYSSPSQQPLSRDKLDFVDRLLPHLRRVITLSRGLYEFSQQSIVGYGLINRMPQPVLLLNLSGKVMHRNAALSRLLEQTTLISVQDEMLHLGKPYDELLAHSLQDVERLHRLRQLDTQRGFQDGFLRISNPDTAEVLYVFASLLTSELEIKNFGMRPLVMLTLYHPDFTAKVDSQLLQAAFALTPAECRVALALLDGFVVKEIAQKHKVTVDTIRKQVHSIYAKTATNKQSELVRLLLNFPREVLEC